MSHTSTINAAVITDVHALRAAINDLKQAGVKCDLLENAVPRAYYSSQRGMEKADLVVKLHDSKYDVGLYKQEGKNSYEARTDFYNHQVEGVLGVTPQGEETPDQARLGKLLNAYAVNAATRKASQQGYQVSRVNNSDGSVQLRLQVSA